MFQRTPRRDGAERVFILLVDGRPTQNEATIIQRANELKQFGVKILPVVFEQRGFENRNLWQQVSSTNYYISIDPSQYNQLQNTFLERIHNYACGKLMRFCTGTNGKYIRNLNDNIFACKEKYTKVL